MRKGDYMIPNNIIEDVLMKLPSKTVCRFGIACKSWYSLISDPIFMNLHSKRALSENPKILFSTIDAQFRLLDYESSSFDHSCLSSPIKLTGNNVTFIGSSCGLVCVVVHESRGNSFCVWNPLTGESRKMPKPDNYHISFYSYRYGFGYDSVANDFKIVMLSIGNSEANIFSLKANLWKQIVIETCLGFTPDSISAMHTPPAVFINGIFYWILLRDNHSYEIVAFNEGKETFEKLQLHLPEDVFVGEFGDCLNLLEHRGCLCFSFSKGGSFHNDIWMMMKECGWVNFLSFKKSDEPFNGYEFSSCISTRNQLVFHNASKFSRCGSRKDKFKLDEIRMSPYVRGAVSYVETLVSPNFPLNNRH